MELVNAMSLFQQSDAGTRVSKDSLEGRVYREACEAVTLLMAPMGPHVAEELWRKLGNTRSVFHETAPVADPKALVRDEITLVVQVAGKLRSHITVPADASKDQIEAAALADEKIVSYLGGKAPARVIYVPGKLVNVVPER